MFDAEWRERVDDCVDDGLRRRDAAGLTRAFDAKRIGGSWQLGEGDVKGADRRLGAACSPSANRSATDPNLGVDGVLEERLTDTLGDPTLNRDRRRSARCW